MFGKRIGYGQEAMPPHNLPFSVIGAGLLWVGWFGFNAGSALAADGLATSAFVATHVADRRRRFGLACDGLDPRKTDDARCGERRGCRLSCDYAGCRLLSGRCRRSSSAPVGGVLCSIACSLKPKFGYDDSLDVVGVHGVGGTWGALATGLFASKAINAAGNDGFFFGNPGQLWTQLISVVVTIAFAMIVTAIILSILKATMGLRVSDEEERMGLDLTQHNERAYE
jgi:Amt family ammonium transporter